MPCEMAKFPSKQSDEALFHALRQGLQGIEGVRVSASGDEAQNLSDLKEALRSKIAELEKQQKSLATD